MTSEDQSTNEYIRSLRSCQLAALQTACELAENLQLEPLEETTSITTQNAVSRLFHRYMMAFVRGLDLERVYSASHCSSLCPHYQLADGGWF